MVPQQNFQPVTPFVSEQEPMAREWVEGQLLANHRGQAIERPPQIGRAGREIDAACGRERQHEVVRSTVTTRRSVSTPTSTGTLRRSPVVKISSSAPPRSSGTIRTGTSVVVFFGRTRTS